MSTRPRNRPSGSWTSTFSSGSGNPASTTASRRCDSIADSAPTRMRSSAVRAVRTPRAPERIAAARSSSVASPAFPTMWSPSATRPSTEKVSAHSNQARAGGLTGPYGLDATSVLGERWPMTPARRMATSRSEETCTVSSSRSARGTGAPQIRAAVTWLKRCPGRSTAPTASILLTSLPAGARTPWRGATRSLRRSRSGPIPARSASPTANGAWPNGTGRGGGWGTPAMIDQSAPEPARSSPDCGERRRRSLLCGTEPRVDRAGHAAHRLPRGRNPSPERTERDRTGPLGAQEARPGRSGRRTRKGPARAACGALATTGTRSPCHPWGRRPAWPGSSPACRRRRPRWSGTDRRSTRRSAAPSA